MRLPRHILKPCLTASLLALLTACSGAETEPQTEELVGGDRSEQGCIGSAGYQWSDLREECIRIWEAGIELVHQGSGDRNFSAYAIISDNQAELFLPDVTDSVLLPRNRAFDDVEEWGDSETDYVLTRDPFNALIITDRDGFVMYRDDTAQPALVELTEHASEQVELELQSAQGTVTQVEDGAYPMFTLHIRLDGDEDTTPFQLIAEGTPIEGASVYELGGQAVSFEYAEVENWDLMSIDPMGTDSLGVDEIGDGWRFVSGRLTGAEAISGGDLPDTVTIQPIHGDAVSFDYFIDENLVALNDTDVSAWLAPNPYKDIRWISVQE